MNFRKRLAFALVVVLGTVSSPGPATASTNGSVTAYTLVAGSYLVDDCQICGRPTILLPMRGTFRSPPVENLLTCSSTVATNRRHPETSQASPSLFKMWVVERALFNV